jgi:hypothetical protein
LKFEGKGILNGHEDYSLHINDFSVLHKVYAAVETGHCMWLRLIDTLSEEDEEIYRYDVSYLYK